MTHRPDQSEAAAYYFTYIDQVAGDDIRDILTAQTAATIAVLGAISEQKSRHRYAPDKWSIRQVVNHINDCERLFVFRAFWFARGFESPLPSFDQNVAVAAADADTRPLHSHIAEFVSIRSATRTLFDGLSDTAWSRRGSASNNPFTVRALAYLTAGHVAHHMRILQDQYLLDLPVS